MPLVFPPLYHRVAALYRRELAAVAGDASKVEPCLRRTFARIADSVIAYWERMEPAEGVR